MPDQPTSTASKRPALLVVAINPTPGAGSEPGKGFNWTRALAESFDIHLVCDEASAQKCTASPLARGWQFHPVDVPYPFKAGLAYYRYYFHWCRAVTKRCRELVKEIQPVGLHHATLGSFRLLPRYETIGVPYSLGPLGGGETASGEILRHAGLPTGELLKEISRGWMNRACVNNPFIRRTLQGAKRIICTTRETESLIRSAGARDTAVVFPDVLEFAIDPAEIRLRRAQQAPALRERINAIWSGRFLWWKGGQLALQLLARLNQQGVAITLDIYSDGAGIDQLKALSVRLGLRDVVFFRGLVPRAELLAAYARSHVFIYPTLHDSSSSAIPEAYSTGLPSITLGLGGTAMAGASGAGLNAPMESVAEWLTQSSALLQAWRSDPGQWLTAVDAAIAKAGDFRYEQLVGQVARQIVPLYLPPAAAANRSNSASAMPTI